MASEELYFRRADLFTDKQAAEKVSSIGTFTVSTTITFARTRRPRCSVTLPITLIALTPFALVRGFSLPILGKRSTDVVRLFESSRLVAAHVPLVRSRVDQLTLRRRSVGHWLPFAQITRLQGAASDRGARRSASTRPPSRASRRILRRSLDTMSLGTTAALRSSAHHRSSIRRGRAEDLPDPYYCCLSSS